MVFGEGDLHPLLVSGPRGALPACLSCVPAGWFEALRVSGKDPPLDVGGATVRKEARQAGLWGPGCRVGRGLDESGRDRRRRGFVSVPSRLGLFCALPLVDSLDSRGSSFL